MQNIIRRASLVLVAVLLAPLAASADEAKLILPDLASVQFLGMSGKALLEAGLIVCALGLVFGYAIYQQLRKLPVHKSMLEVSELIYETCKTYLVTQG
ncbi:MAG: sodium-translocating pyrophosphatase, partial [Myxococcales bacterium]